MYLPKNIRYLRKKFDLSQDDLAAKLGYKSYTTIQKWESGVSEPPFKALAAMSKLFGCDMNEMANENLELKSSNNVTAYYLDPETAERAQAMKDNDQLRLLFDTARDSTPQDVQTAYDVLLALKRKETYSDD